MKIPSLARSNVRMQSPVNRFQIFTVSRLETVSTISNENTADITQSSCPLSVIVHSPVTAFQSFAVPSAEAVTTDAPCSPHGPCFEETADIT